MAHASQTVWDTASKIVLTANAGFVAIITWFTGEAKEKAEKQVDEFEQHVERLAKNPRRRRH